MRTITSVGLLILLLGTSPVPLAADHTGSVAGSVHLRVNPTYPTVVYIDEMSDQTFTPPSANPSIEHQRKMFSPRVLPVLLGTTVDFLNRDHRKHNLFSPDGEKYDLGSWGKGEKRSYTFKRAGVYTQVCSLHPQMIAYVVVVKTPYFAVADEAGSYRILNVPAGEWKLKVWNERLAPSHLSKSYPVKVAPGQETKIDIAIASLPTGEKKYWLEPQPPAGAGLVQRGAWLFRQKGCFLCHGPEGGRGVPNKNYVAGVVPALNTLAERLMLFDPEDVKAIAEQLEQGRDLESLTDSPPVSRFNVFLAQYRSARDVIRNGSHPGKRNQRGPKPPLAMPRWESILSKADIDALIAYLLTLQPWEEKEP
ncbi:MAG: c-type cytochrome [Acidobacteria bacterium]|nr:c-type cytochrome [Acidobacteriota bacterium]